MSFRNRLPALWLLPVVAAGCYRYTPVATPEPGMEIRAQLGTEAAVRRSVGLTDPIRYYDGVVVDVAPDAFSVDVLIARSSSTFRDVTIRDTVRIGRGEVESIMRRSISPGRTALFVLGAGAAAYAIVKGIDSVVGGTDEPPGGGEPNVVLVPVFSWRVLRILPEFRFARE